MAKIWLWDSHITVKKYGVGTFIGDILKLGQVNYNNTLMQVSLDNSCTVDNTACGLTSPSIELTLSW